MGVTRFLAAVWLLTVCVASVVHAQKIQLPTSEDEEIHIDAEQISYDQKADTVVAEGNVVITRGDTVLHADQVRVNRTTNEADARGHVTLTQADGTIVADALHLNLDEETGLLEKAEVTSRRFQYSLWGDRIEKGLGQCYHIENGRFTMCRCAEGAPSWSVSGRTLDITVGGYGTLTGGTFNVLDVPVLYVPRAVFPAQRDRQSGFLTPRFGVSNLRGFQALLPFYWAIDKSQDATVALDLETSARAGIIGEYRYALSRETSGLLSGSYLNESFRGSASGQPFELTVPENRWNLMAEHTQPFIGESHAYADVFVVGDNLFLRDINTFAFDHSQDVAIRTMPFTISHVGALQLWDRVALKGEATYYQDLTGPSSHTLQRAPEIDLWGQKRFGLVITDVTGSAVDFQRSRDTDGVRVDVEPAATVPLPLGRYLFGAVRASLRETAYHLTEDNVSETGQDLPRDASRETMSVGAEVGTEVDRIYSVHWLGLEKIKHTLEPQISYLYVPSVGQDELPLFDGVDRTNRRNLFTYGVVSRFIGKFADGTGSQSAVPSSAGSSLRELGRLSLTQSVDIGRDIDTLQPDRVPDHFSDLDIAGSINPSRALSMRFLTNYDTGNNSITATRVGLFIEDPRYPPSDNGPHLDTRTSAGVSYRFLTQSLLQELDDNIVLRLTDTAGFLYASRYDVVANRFLDNFVGLRFTSACNCWALDLAVTNRTNPQETEFRAQLTLAGFGSSKSQSRVAAAP
ncbi:MAG: LPS-assembly protein LptD [Candidatus Binatia bacterium]